MFFVFTGPESSGKTTFANFAFSVFGGGLVPEYARQYLERQQGRYTFGDLKIMAENQYEFEEEQKLKYPYVSVSYTHLNCYSAPLAKCYRYQIHFHQKNTDV